MRREIYLQAGRSHAMPPGNVTADHAGGAGAARRLVRGGAEMSMADLILRGRTLSFLRWPDSADDHRRLSLRGRRRAADPRRQDRRGRRLCRSRRGRPGRCAADRPPAASDPARLHRRACAFPADAGHRLLWRRAARLAEQIHLPRGDQVLQPAARPPHRAAVPRRDWCATARRRSPPIARSTRNRPRPSSPRRTSATCWSSPAR